MDTTDITDLLEELGENIDDLEDALKPLLEMPIAASAASLPPLDRAKLYTWTTYAVETILFSHVRLNGADGKAHPVFTELRRVQQYMQKIHEVENPVGKRENLSLNKPAAGRFIKAALSGNDRYDRELAEKKGREAEGARIKFEQLSKKRKAEDVEDADEEAGEDEPEPEHMEVEAAGMSGEGIVKGETVEGEGASTDTKKKKKRRKGRKDKREEAAGVSDKVQSHDGEGSTKKKKKRSKKLKAEG